ncbi:signal peptidase II [Candidatus Kinetoplastidibacterium crithidiae]|uniref:Lipoprotein signal peptidase n=1 Tax=Candidatus Kinetoplastidibacterium crithidiae TCC036E TaxID=1208918 RepID=M1M5U4_9PROT|nr:signal peptidase II [Candidatus Kinetoplastibacterium crithidii]AFZ82827.1 signal peptidase II [Candidatus Kinetoplastibacterium crithidii (ex Angomonas deanei ATCC 30255)]AGF47520.1 signal peptidase II [Candidatus Kinetoplastibacterium crithidii TCC036E]
MIYLPYVCSSKKYIKKIYYFLILLLIFLDQLSKLYIDKTIEYGDRIYVTSCFNLTLIYNWGAAFSLLSNQEGNQKYLFILIGISVSCFILMILNSSNTTKTNNIALAMIMAGTIGNMIDRFYNGYVIDFLLFYWDDFFFPVFNLADVYISIGVILFCFIEIRLLKNKNLSITKKL